MDKARSFILPFIKKEEVAHNTYTFYFDRSQNSFDYIPGQYLYMTLPHNNPDERGTSRYFTIASSPREKKYLMITTKLIRSTFKETLHRLKPKDEVQFFGPMGWFLLPKDEQVEKVFLAGGIGITPFHSLLHTVVDEQLATPMTLFASFRKREDVLFYDSLQEIERKNKQIRVIYTLTQEKSFPEWKGETGRISQELVTKYISDLHKKVFYIVGAPRMVAETRAMLLKAGIPDEQIQVEDFTGY